MHGVYVYLRVRCEMRERERELKVRFIMSASLSSVNDIQYGDRGSVLLPMMKVHILKFLCFCIVPHVCCTSMLGYIRDRPVT
jgi:hypothetical protein